MRAILRGLRRIPPLIRKLDRLCRLVEGDPNKLDKLEQKVDRVETKLDTVLDLLPPRPDGPQSQT